MLICAQCRFGYEAVDPAPAEQVTTTAVEFGAVLFFARHCRR
jgi:hypothetical protein